MFGKLGMLTIAGEVVCDPIPFGAGGSRKTRAEHILRRLAFVRAMFAGSGVDHVVLYRGLSFVGTPRPSRRESFVSATFHRDVALAHYNERDREATGILVRQRVPVDRLFMTYLETGAMN